MSEKILIVDDDEEFRVKLTACLEAYEVESVACGKDALRILRRPHMIDLVILDENLPDFKGTEMLKKIKEASPLLPVMILTGFGSKDIAVAALKGRADDYLEKPVSPGELTLALERLLNVSISLAENSGGNSGKVELVKRFIERNCFKKITLSDAAAKVFLSPKYLSKIFAHISGVSFGEYKQGVKLRKAKELLDSGKLSVGAIAYKMGFKNPESFMRMFAKTTGQTPSQYRKFSAKRKSSAVEPE
ncbi:MAG: response regulator [Elusimicrobiota bacterium]|nr:response regulator [Elusimicrobiota bacterium]